VIIDGDGLELHGYRPTEFGRRYFGPEIDQSEVVGANTNRPSPEGRSRAGRCDVTSAATALDHNRVQEPRS
jgi:hypothetical protein